MHISNISNKYRHYAQTFFSHMSLLIHKYLFFAHSRILYVSKKSNFSVKK